VGRNRARLDGFARFGHNDVAGTSRNLGGVEPVRELAGDTLPAAGDTQPGLPVTPETRYDSRRCSDRPARNRAVAPPL
jgi:hypothetical protein